MSNFPSCTPFCITRRYTTRENSDFETKHEDFQEIRFNMIATYFIQLATVNKLKILSRMASKMKTRISLVLNAIGSLYYDGKIIKYQNVATEQLIKYDRILFDHDRMLSQAEIDVLMFNDIEWFASLDESRQLSYFISLIRFGGGGVFRLIYRFLYDLYYKEKGQIIAKCKTEPKAPHEICEKKKKVLKTVKYDFSDPTHTKVKELTKTWNGLMKRYRKKLPKTPKKKQESLKKGKTPKKQKKKKSKKNTKVVRIDWVCNNNT